jgi:hypothetical protein
MNLLARATRMPMRGKVHVSEDRFALRFWYGKISDRFCSELPHEWGLLSGRIEKVFCVLVAWLWFAGGFSARAIISYYFL